MRIARPISVCMMYAVSHQPLNGTTFESQCSAGNEKVFNQFCYFLTAMVKQTVIANAYTKTPANPVKNYSGDYSRPAPKEKCCDGAKMGANKENTHSPIDVWSLRRRRSIPTFV